IRDASPHDMGGFEFGGSEQLIFPAGAGFGDVKCGKNAPVGETAIEYDFEVARALELLGNDIVHHTAGVDQCRGNDRQRPVAFELPRGTKEAFREFKSTSVESATHSAAATRVEIVRA